MFAIQIFSVIVRHVKGKDGPKPPKSRIALRFPARLKYHLHRSDHVVSLHWLCAREGIQFKYCCRPVGLLNTTFCVNRHRNTLEPSPASPTCLTTDLSALLSDTNRLVVPPVKLSTVGSRAFPVVGPQIWNDLPEDVTSAESSTFRRRLKLHLFINHFLTLS